MLEQKREEATAVLLMMMIDDEDDKEWKSEGREVGSRSVKIVNWEEERVVSVNNNVFSTRWAADQSRLSIGRRRGGSLSTTTFFPPGRRYPQSDCSLEGSGRVIGCLS